MQENEEEILIPTLAEQPQEEVRTIEEDIHVVGVESLNGESGDLTLKSINGENLVGSGNIQLATSAQLSAETQAREQADSALQTAVGAKQDKLTDTQLSAVNSGIDQVKVGQIQTNAIDIVALQNGKQNTLTQDQLNAVNSGIDQAKVTQIATNTGNISTNTSSIATINGKIPSSASSSNQLTDKNYVDNAIATNTANYISDNGQPFQSYADLVAYSGELTNNDYAFVETVDSAGNDIYTRYKYNADQELWAEEYTITNPYFTATQWASIDSGVTANDVAQIGTNKTDIATLGSTKQDNLSQTQLSAVDSGIDSTKVTQIATNAGDISNLQAGKQDKLIASTNIQIASDGKTISATDTTYTAGTGLTLTGTQFSVNEPAPSGFFTDTTSTATGTGSTINLTGTAEAVLDSVKLAGDTFQQSYTGKNLMLPKATPGGGYTKSYNSITGAYSASGTSESAWTWLTGYCPLSKTIPANTTFTFSRQASSSFSLSIRTYHTDNTYSSYSLGKTTLVVRITEEKDTNRIVLMVAESGVDVTQTNYYQVELGSTATSFEPYVGGMPSPNPDYPQDIETVTGNQTVQFWGKNLFNENATTETRYIGSNGAWYDPGTALYINQEYTIGGGVDISFSFSSKVGGAYVRFAEFDLDGTFIQRILVDSESTLTTDSNTAKVIFSTNAGSSIYFDGLQIELASSPTTYTPYQGQSYTIDLGSIELCKIGTYQDYIWKDGDTWKIHKKVGKRILEGNDGTWGVVQRTNGTQFDIGNSDGINGTTTGLWFVCDNFSSISFEQRDNVANSIYGYTDDRIRINTTVASTSPTFNTWLSAHPTTIYFVYDSASTTDTAITDSTLIAQLEALANAQSYNPITNINSSTPAPNLPAILTVDVFKNNWVGTLAGYNEELKRLADRIESLEASL